MIYADHNATSPLRPEARQAMLSAFDLGAANPSSVHSAGRAARKMVEQAREQVGGAIGSRAQDIIFTSGGTEADGLAIHGAVAALDRKCTLLVSAIEHEAVVKAAAEEGVDGVVCGHIHQAEITRMHDILYMNCGDWVESCTALVERHDGSVELLEWREAGRRMKVEAPDPQGDLWDDLPPGVKEGLAA